MARSTKNRKPVDKRTEEECGSGEPGEPLTVERISAARVE